MLFRFIDSVLILNSSRYSANRFSRSRHSNFSPDRSQVACSQSQALLNVSESNWAAKAALAGWLSLAKSRLIIARAVSLSFVIGMVVAAVRAWDATLARCCGVMFSRR